MLVNMWPLYTEASAAPKRHAQPVPEDSPTFPTLGAAGSQDAKLKKLELLVPLFVQLLGPQKPYALFCPQRCKLKRSRSLC